MGSNLAPGQDWSPLELFMWETGMHFQGIRPGSSSTAAPASLSSTPANPALFLSPSPYICHISHTSRISHSSHISRASQNFPSSRVLRCKSLVSLRHSYIRSAGSGSSAASKPYSVYRITSVDGLKTLLCCSLGVFAAAPPFWSLHLLKPKRKCCLDGRGSSRDRFETI